MKRILSVIFVISIIFSLSSCDIPTFPTDSIPDASSSQSWGIPTTSTQNAYNSQGATIEETLLYSENDVKIIAKSLNDNKLRVYIENNSNLNFE